MNDELATSGNGQAHVDHDLGGEVPGPLVPDERHCRPDRGCDAGNHQQDRLPDAGEPHRVDDQHVQQQTEPPPSPPPGRWCGAGAGRANRCRRRSPHLPPLCQARQASAGAGPFVGKSRLLRMRPGRFSRLLDGRSLLLGPAAGANSASAARRWASAAFSFGAVRRNCSSRPTVPGPAAGRGAARCTNRGSCGRTTGRSGSSPGQPRPAASAHRRCRSAHPPARSGSGRSASRSEAGSRCRVGAGAARRCAMPGQPWRLLAQPGRHHGHP